MDRLAEECGGAGVGERLQTAGRLDANDADHRNKGKHASGLADGGRVECAVAVDEQDVAVGGEAAQSNHVEVAERQAKAAERDAERVCGSSARSPPHTAKASEVLDRARIAHEATRRAACGAAVQNRGEFHTR